MLNRLQCPDPPEDRYIALPKQVQVMNRDCINQLVNFVQREFGVSQAEVITVLQHDESVSQFPIILWQYGFITVQQLDRLFDWLIGAQLRSLDG